MGEAFPPKSVSSLSAVLPRLRTESKEGVSVAVWERGGGREGGWEKRREMGMEEGEKTKASHETGSPQ